MPAELVQPDEILSQLIRIPSVNPMRGEVDRAICFEHRVSDWLEEFFRAIGAPYERIEVVGEQNPHPSRDNLVARYDAGEGKPTILLDAHQDTVPVDGMNDAFQPRRRDDRIYGRGACDVKGGMAAMLSAFARLFHDRPAGAANVVLSCSCDEEATAMGVRHLVTYWEDHSEKSQLLCKAPSACLVAEPTELDVVVAHRGVLRLRVHTRGRACHASEPSQGKNAIYAMAPLVGHLESVANALTADSHGDPLCGNPALSVGLIQGGSAVNIVPAQCVIDIDRRLIPGEAPQQVWEQLRQDLSRFEAAHCEAPWLAAPALDNQSNGLLAQELLASIGSVGLSSARTLGVPYCTNASTIAAAGVPTVVCGPGSITQAHTVDEYIEVNQLEQAAEVYYHFCSSYGDFQPSPGAT